MALIITGAKGESGPQERILASTMRVLMLTNTYLPHVGGVARAVQTMAAGLRARGHAVRIVAPEFPDFVPDPDVIRVPAIQNFHGSDFSVSLPVPGFLDEPVDAFSPDLVHAHHPFLLGDTALRLAAERRLPLVFTHHTLYERYTHYLAGEFPALKRFARELPTEYANLCDQVIAPSESIANLLRRRGVQSPLNVVPTGVDTEFFGSGNRERGRLRLGLPPDAFVVGHVGRLAREKNLGFLARALGIHLAQHPEAWLLVAGTGAEAEALRQTLARAGVGARLHMAGVQQGRELADLYAAMDVFVFASTSETQGLVLTEAMAAGVPVLALDATGVRDVVKDGWNGRLLRRSNVREFAATLNGMQTASEAVQRRWSEHARQTARAFGQQPCLDKLLQAYEAALIQGKTRVPEKDNPWETMLRRLQAEWKLLGAKATALGEALIA